MKNCQSQGNSGKYEIVLTNYLENAEIGRFVSIFCHRIRVISVTYCYTADKLELGKKIE